MNDFLQNPNNGQKNRRGTRTRKVFDSSHSYNSNPKFHSGKYQGVRNGNMQRPGNGRQNYQSNSGEKMSLLSSETVDTIVSLFRTMTTNQELLLDVQERRVVAEERKADALENIAEYFSAIFAQNDLQTEDGEMVMDESFHEEEGDFSAEPCQMDNSTEFCSESKQDIPHNNIRKIINSGTTATKKKEKSSDIPSSDIPSASSLDKKILSREEAMETIYRMRDQGATFNQIAEYFIEIGQPTFSGKGKWHAQTIHRLLQKQKHFRS